MRQLFEPNKTNMHSTTSSVREATQVCLRGCCPYPIILNVPEPAEQQQQAMAKTRNTSATCRRNFATTTVFPNTNFTNHESIPSLQESFLQFIKSYPKYSDTSIVDRIRAQEYPQLSHTKHVSLDYIGVGLFSQSQSENNFPFFDLNFKMVNLKTQLLDENQGSSQLQSAIEKRIMDFLNISKDDYSMVFTANRSSAFRLVAESYPFQSNRKLLTVYDHESEAIDGMINASEKRGARATSAEFKWPRLRINSPKLRKIITRKNNNMKKQQQQNRGLFVFPLQSRMSGVSYSYQWMTLAQENGWHVLLDACALGPKDMDSFGLSLFQPDFLVCSFYKVFGENPTGFGCLLVKKSVVPILQCSGTSGIVSITPAKNLFDFLEDSSGTDTELEQISRHVHSNQSGLERHVNTECKCLDHVDSLGLMLISSRGRYLINWLVSALMKLQHPNRLEDFPVVTIYGPKVKFERGPALVFNLYDWKGEKVEPVLVQKLADRNNISIGHGFLHHIWFPDKSEEEKQKFMDRNMKQKETGKMTKSGKLDQGMTVVTVALTFLADFEDVYKLWAFVAQFLDADFVEKERWRYTALNQKTVEVVVYNLDT